MARKRSILLPTRHCRLQSLRLSDCSYRSSWLADIALLSGVSEAQILEVKRTEIHEKVSQSIKSRGWLPNLFRSIVGRAKEFLQNLIRQHAMPPKPVLNLDIAEFRHMQTLMIKAQNRAREIHSLQNDVLPKLKTQLAETKGIFKGKERRGLETQIAQTEQEIAQKLNDLPAVLMEDGYPDVQAFMRTFREMESVVEQYNRDLAEWERKVQKKQPAEKERYAQPEKDSVRNRLRQLQEHGRQRNQPRQRTKSFDRDSR